MKTKSRPEFCVDVNGGFYGKMMKDVVAGVERKVGVFTEVLNDDGEFTFRIDFKLGGGFFYGWLISDMIKEQDGINSLLWIMSKDFPDEVKGYILKLLAKNNLIDEDTIEALEAEQE